MRGPGPVRRNRDAARPPSPPDTPPPPPPSPSRPSRLWPARPSSTPAARHAAAALSVASPGHVARAGPLSGLVTWPAGRPRPTHPTRLSPSSRPGPFLLAPCPRESESRLTSGPLVRSPSSRPLICFFITSPPSSRPLVTSPRPSSSPLVTSSLLFLPYALSSRLLICFFITASRHVL